MADICCGSVSKSSRSSTGSGAESKPYCYSSSRAARRRRMEIRRFKFASPVNVTEPNPNHPGDEDKQQQQQQKRNKISESGNMNTSSGGGGEVKYGVATVCGRRRDMEDAVAVHPFLFNYKDEPEAKSRHWSWSQLHYFAVYDGHGCSHVARRCRERLHELVREEVEMKEEEEEWKRAMERSFCRMDKEVVAWNDSHVVGAAANCRCELQTPECDAVGSTAVVVVLTPRKIVVANCGDSRAVLCRRAGKVVPLSSDHKPDRPDELNRIQAAGGRVIYWDGPRVLGVLAMSRAIGDNYLKPYVSCEPEVTITDRTSEDDCLIIASDGLWDVVSNDTACGVARMCLRGKTNTGPEQSTAGAIALENVGRGTGSEGVGVVVPDKACSDASMLLTKLALARHSPDNVSVVVVDLKP